MGKKKAPKRNPTKTKQPKAAAKSKRRLAKKDNFIGRLDGVLKVVGDLEEPLVPLEAWEYD